MTARALPDLASRIRRALLGMVLAAVAVAAAGALVIGHHALYRQTESHLAALVMFTAAQSQGALLFADAEAARDVLKAIPAEEGIRVAEIRQANGAVLAHLEHPEHALPAWVERLLAPAAVSHPVAVDGRTVGTVMLEAGARPLVESMKVFLIFDLFGGLVMALVVFVVARRLTQQIAYPLDDLGTLMREMHAGRDYARRAPGFAVAEIDALGTEFNALLGEIQRRDEELKRANAALKRLALRDPLTGLANRAMFEAALLEALGRDDRAGVGLLYFDLDSFKAVNDTFGHAAGDLLLKTIAARLAAEVPAGAVAARMGGDEFVVLLPETGTRDALASLAERLQHALHAPLRVGAHVLHPGASVGHAVSGEDVDASQLIELADRAMYAAKARRREAGIRTRWERAQEAAENEPLPPRMRVSGPMQILGDRDGHKLSA